MTVREHEEQLVARHPALRVRTFELGSSSWLELSARIGPVEQFDRYKVLCHNFDLQIGQIVAIDGAYQMRQVLPASHPPEIVDSVAGKVVEAADEFRKFFEVKR